jgi:uncharacterized protein
MITIAEIRRYPVKSMGGEVLVDCDLGPLGIAGDRAYAVRDVETGKVISAKQPRLGGPLLGCSARYAAGPDSPVVISIDGTEFSTDGDRAALDGALSELLGRAVALTSSAADNDVYESYWPEIDGLALSDTTTDFPVAMATTKGTFVDLAGLHLLATSSIEHLASMIPDSVVNVDRFRPGILLAIGTVAGFVESDWVQQTARLGSASISFGTVAPRCIMPTLAQPGLPRDPSILQTIARGWTHCRRRRPCHRLTGLRSGPIRSEPLSTEGLCRVHPRRGRPPLAGSEDEMASAVVDRR